MNSRVKEKWVAALRSGEYKQGQYSLRNNSNQFCCLGVLCDLYDKEQGSNSWNLLSYDYGFGHEESTEVPPFRVWSSWAGMAEHNPVIQFPDGPQSLAELNDQGYTFEEIANLIEMCL